MNRFMEYVELDLSLEIFIFKTVTKEIKSTVKINNKLVKEIKLKREAILFTSFDEDDKENVFIIEVYTQNNHIITLTFSLKDEALKDDFEKFKEYIKSLIL